jgi:glycosyltransferase involved in cell wall biosynthesis
VKLAVLSHILPPSPSGQAVVLYRLLRDWNPEDYCLLSRENHDAYPHVQNSPSGLPARYYHLLPGFRLKGSSRLSVLAVLDTLLQVLQRARSVVHVVKRERCGAIMACSGDLIDLPAGYLASRWARVPFYAYLFDDYVYQWTRRLYRGFARYVESRILKHAAGVIVPNEFLRDEYRHRYRVEATIIRNPCEVLGVERQNRIAWPAREGEVRIVYTGALYHANYDSFPSLVAAIGQLGRLDVKLHLYTARSPTELKQHDICGPVVYHPHLARLDVLEVQRHADILFLPLAFASSIPQVIKTSAPGKMGEYLASGRPVLVHAPADSFVSWYFKEHECGVIVDANEPAMLAQAIRQITEDAALRCRLGENARARAAADFNPELTRAEFFKLFQSRAGGP